ncbi:MAG TPA: dihydroorotase [Candidatus Tumulicola sp.]
MADGLLVAGGRLVDPAAGLDALRDLRIANGRVVEIGEHLQPHRDEIVIDARGAVVAPGFIDMHVHLREPGFEEKETIATGTEAAVRGGFTAVACMPNTRPALDTPSALDALAGTIANSARCRVYPIAAITRERLGREPCDFAGLTRAGAVAFSDDGDTVDDVAVLRAAALEALEVRGSFISHCEAPSLKGSGVMNAGPVALELGLTGSPAVAENAIVARDLLLALDTGKAWHIAHLTTRVGLDLVRLSRSWGGRATCEVTPHHLTFGDDAVRELGTAAKVNPPLRGDADVRAVRDGVRDGTVDVFASDHAPHTAAEKALDFANAAVGFSGLEIAVGAYAAALPDLPLRRFVELLSTNPARILHVEGGHLAIGARAHVTIFADRTWRVDPAGFASKGKVTPFAGQTLPRRAIATIVDGRIAYRDVPAS